MTVVKTAVSIKTQRNRPQRLKRIIGLKDFCEKRNKILILRGVGGLGDILMHRMIFEDIKLLMPNAEIHFACPWKFHDAVRDHPFIDKLLRVEDAYREDYVVSYNTTTACGRYEMKISPLSDLHRSDIWANHCGFKLTRHDMHFHLTEDEKRAGKELIESKRDRDGPSIAIAPISAMPIKNLLDHQLLGLVAGIHKLNCYAFGLHSNLLYPFFKNDIPYLYGLNLRQWLGVIYAADYVVSVDSATFHCAGGMQKPVTGIFTFVNGKTYGQHYRCAEIVQGPCPLAYTGCYNWGICPKQDAPLKPCLTELTTEDMLEGVIRMLEKTSVKS